MKKLLISLLAILMLSACGKQEAPVQPPMEEPEVIHTPVEEEQIVAHPEQDVEPMPEEPRDWTPEPPLRMKAWRIHLDMERKSWKV